MVLYSLKLAFILSGMLLVKPLKKSESNKFWE